jgi:hemoglobin
MKYDKVTRDNIKILIDMFYKIILQDKQLSGFFIEKLGNDMNSKKWETHLEILTNFWASLLIKDKSYRSSPILAHIGMNGLSEEDFEQWLYLFSICTKKVYIEDISNTFNKYAQNTAKSIKRGIKL